MARFLNIMFWALLLVANAGAYASWTVRYQHTDTLGSVITESNSQGSITQRFDYKPFGEGSPTQKSGLGYTGHLEDTDLGLTYMQQRYYDPMIGRFYSNDPVGFTGEPDTFNRYSYVANNPYKYTDPTGEAKYKGDKSGIATGNLIARGIVAVTEKGSPINNAAQRYVDITQKMISDGSMSSSRAARREVMRQQNIPTSQQPSSQSKNDSGYEYTYDVPKKGGGAEQKSVQQQTMDRSHPDEKHWEAGSVRTDPITGETRMTEHGRPKLTNDKSKVNYDEEK